MEKPPHGEPWYDETLSEEDKLYEDSVNRIKGAVKQGLSFEQATGLIEVKDDDLKAAIVDDALKVLVAEMHFSGEAKPLKDLARSLKLPLKRLEKAKEEMLRAVEAAAIEKFKASQGKSGTA